MELYSEKIEALIKAALADGKLTDKERQVLMRKAAEEGIDQDEFEMVLEARLLELQEKKEMTLPSSPKSSKKGDIRICPACGHILGAFQGYCPECGYEFVGIAANIAYSELAKELKKTKSLEKKAEIIENFCVPNTKEDLLEFLIALKPKLMDFSDPLMSRFLKSMKNV